MQDIQRGGEIRKWFAGFWNRGGCSGFVCPGTETGESQSSLDGEREDGEREDHVDEQDRVTLASQICYYFSGRGIFQAKPLRGCRLAIRTLNHVRQRAAKDMTCAGELLRA
jgi:hypothetical protein